MISRHNDRRNGRIREQERYVSHDVGATNQLGFVCYNLALPTKCVFYTLLPTMGKKIIREKDIDHFEVRTQDLIRSSSVKDA